MSTQVLMHGTRSFFFLQASAVPQEQGMKLPHFSFSARNCRLQETHLKKTMSLLSERLLQPRGGAQGKVIDCSSPAPQHPSKLQRGRIFTDFSSLCTDLLWTRSFMRDSKGEVTQTLLEASSLQRPTCRAGRRAEG